MADDSSRDRAEQDARRDREASSRLDEMLTSRSLIFVTGKGGVGKSAVAAALALRARTLGLLPMLFECDAPLRPSLFPGGVPVSDTLKEVVPGVLAVNQNTEEAVKAYALAAIPSKTIADLLFENRVTRLFLSAAPSVNEMALIGRIVQLVEAHEQNGPVIVDLHATGHALAMLRAPDGIMRVLRAGPVYERAAKVRDVIFDANRTAVVTVALPEELPVTEILEMLAALREMRTPLGPVICNGVMEDPVLSITDSALLAIRAHSDGAARAVDDAMALRGWARRATRERDRLVAGTSTLALPVLTIPYMCDLSSSETLAGRMAAVLDEVGDRRG